MVYISTSINPVEMRVVYNESRTYKLSDDIEFTPSSSVSPTPICILSILDVT